MEIYKPQKKENYKLCLLMCCVISVMLCFAQILGYTLGVFLVFVIFVIFVLFYSLRNLAVPILLFFLPWSSLIKFAPGQLSVYTIVFFLVSIMAFLKNYSRAQFNYFIFPMLILAITGVSKIAGGYYIDNGYILFIVFLFFFPMLTYETEGSYDYYIITIFFVFGIITSSLLAKEFSTYPTISRFIDVFSWKEMGLVRHSGFYQDSNFYSAHIAPALTAVLLLLLKNHSKKRFLMLILSAVMLLYSGFLGASKSFIIITLIVFFLWFLVFLFTKNKISTKLVLILSIVFIILFIFTSSAFSESLEVIMIRFGQGMDADTLTTGRNNLWQSYIDLFLEDGKVLFFGVGYTDLNHNGRASHNTLIQMVYQFGLVGCTFLVLWITTLVKNILHKAKIKAKHFPALMIMLLGTFGLWMSLDVMFLDEFFLIVFYFLFGLKWLVDSSFLPEVQTKIDSQYTED